MKKLAHLRRQDRIAGKPFDPKILQHEAQHALTMPSYQSKAKHSRKFRPCPRVREQLLKSRTALVNQLRGLLAEHGMVAPQGIARARRLLLEILADANHDAVSSLFRETLQEIAERLPLPGRTGRCIRRPSPARSQEYPALETIVA